MSVYFGPIYHVGIMVPDIDEAMNYWIKNMGVGPWFRDDYEFTNLFTYKGQKTHVKSRVALAYSGELNIELIEENGPGPSPMIDFLNDFKGGANHAMGGVQHFGIMVENWDEAMARPGVEEMIVMKGAAGPVRLAYLRTSPLPGTMLELVEKHPLEVEKFEFIKAAAKNWDGKDPIRFRPKNNHNHQRVHETV